MKDYLEKVDISSLISRMRKWARCTGDHYDIPLYQRDNFSHRKAEYFFDPSSEIGEVRVICSQKTEALEIQITYKDERGKIIENPAVLVTPEGNMIRYHGDFLKIKHDNMPWVKYGKVS